MTRGLWLVALAAIVGIAWLAVIDRPPEGAIDGPVLSEPARDIRTLMQAALQGTVVYDDEIGCLYLESSRGTREPIVWPPHTTWRSNPPGVVLAGGMVIEPGAHIKGGGGGVGNVSPRVGDRVAAAAADCGGGGALSVQTISDISE